MLNTKPPKVKQVKNNFIPDIVRGLYGVCQTCTILEIYWYKYLSEGKLEKDFSNSVMSQKYPWQVQSCTYWKGGE